MKLIIIILVIYVRQSIDGHGVKVNSDISKAPSKLLMWDAGAP